MEGMAEDGKSSVEMESELTLHCAVGRSDVALAAAAVAEVRRHQEG